MDYIDFDNIVKNSIELLTGKTLSEINGICAGISGGADSISLLTALCHTSKNYGFCVNVLTVDHGIRSEEESGGDVRFVENYCFFLRKSGFNVNCSICTLKRGMVQETAAKRRKGVEEAARFLRYEAFEKYAEHTGCDFFCLAHNQNDQLETLLMRFFQGGGTTSRAGILPKRGIFIRPLLSVSRSDIETYLNSQNIKWRTDVTNFDQKYLRNKIRGTLIPFLDIHFSGWSKAVLAGGEKAFYDGLLIDQAASGYMWHCSNDGKSVYIELSEFSICPISVRHRLIYEAFNVLHISQRIPYETVRKICFWPEKYAELVAFSNNEGFKFTASGLDFLIRNGNLFIKLHENKATETFFFDIIESAGVYPQMTGILSVFQNDPEHKELCEICFEGKDCEALSYSGIKLPFCFRSRMSGDSVITKDGRMKSLSDVLSDWKVPVEIKSLIPVIQNLNGNNDISLVWGSVFGFPDWKV